MNSPAARKPIVLVPCDNRVYDDRPMQLSTIPLLCTGNDDVEAAYSQSLSAPCD